jgi:DNA-binding NarL/FixJ family response regulator
MGNGSFGTPQVRVIVVGEGDAHRYGIRALVTRVLREELGDDVAAFRDDAEPCLDPQANLPARSADTRDAPLSTRELEVLGMLAQGRRNKEIAEELFISPSTVNYHLTAIFNKLTVTNRTEAVAVALRRGFITLDASTLLPGQAA